MSFSSSPSVPSEFASEVRAGVEDALSNWPRATDWIVTLSHRRDLAVGEDYVIRSGDDASSCFLDVSRDGLSTRRQVAPSEADVRSVARDFVKTALRTKSHDANLSGADLRGRNLAGFEFTRTSLVGARLRGADLASATLIGADLTNADLTGAQLSGANLIGAKLDGTRLRDATLRRTLFVGDDGANCTRGLMAHQLSGCDLQGAVLPPGVDKFDALAPTQEACHSATTLFISLLVACGYSVLTLATATDPGLLTNTGSLTLPLLNAPIQLSYFFLVAPVLLLAVYLYFHVHLQRMWEAIADLPAIFPDGVTLDRRLNPWIPTSLVCSYMPHLRHRRSALHSIGWWLVVLFIWWGVPFVTLLFWARYLSSHSEASFTLAALTAGAFVAALLFNRLAVLVLKGGSMTWTALLASARRDRGSWAGVLLTALVAVGLLLATQHALSGPAPYGFLDDYSAMHPEPAPKPKGRIDRWWTYIANFPYANFVQADLSTRPATGSAPTDPVKGALLREANLRFAHGRQSYLAGAELQGSDLTGAQLTRVDLTGAKLGGAILTGAMLDEATLKAADLRLTVAEPTSEGNYSLSLEHANLQSADLSQSRLAANMSSAVLVGALLQGATLSGLSLEEANFRGASAIGADLSDSYLSDASFTDAYMGNVSFYHATGVRVSFMMANLDNANFQRVSLHHTVFARARLRCANMMGADLQWSDLTGARLRRAQLHLARLSDVNASGADLTSACLVNANLRDARFYDVDFALASLDRADLRWVRVGGANFAGASLREADLRFVDLSEVRGLTCGQVATAVTDETTVLPPLLHCAGAAPGPERASTCHTQAPLPCSSDELLLDDRLASNRRGLKR
jgi:uncharacterized protein YjbI with pentapeptide repeats